MRKTDNNYKINYQIKSEEVRIVEGLSAPEVLKTKEAIKIAQNSGLDLIEINPNSNPPICKILDFSKFLYEIKKKKKESESNSQKTIIKELRMTSNIDNNDVETKKNQARNFFSKGNKVKFVMIFKARNISHKDIGEMTLLNMIESLSDIALPEGLPRMEGNKMFAILRPIKK